MYPQNIICKNTGRLVLKQTSFSALASKLNTGLINKGWYGMFFACKVLRIADVSNVSPSSEHESAFFLSNPNNLHVLLVIDTVCECPGT